MAANDTTTASNLQQGLDALARLAEEVDQEEAAVEEANRIAAAMARRYGWQK